MIKNAQPSGEAKEKQHSELEHYRLTGQKEL